MGQAERYKRYVGVISHVSADGIVTPLTIRWTNTRDYRIDRVDGCHQSHSFRTGGTGMCYTIFVGGTKTHLWYDDYRKSWFVEAKRERE